MYLQDSEELAAYRARVRALAETEIAPRAPELDRKGEFHWETVPKLAEAGLFGVIFPEEYGGQGLDYAHYAIAVEEVSRACGGHGLTVASHNSLCSNHIYMAGTEEQKRKYLPMLTSGEKLGAWGLTEPNAGSDAGGQQTVAVLDGDEWVLNGQKIFITQGSVGSIFVAIAVTDRSLGNKGISAFIVEKGTPGFRPGQVEHKLGLRCSDTAELIFEDCRIPGENLLGELNRGFIDTLRVLDGGRISIGSMGLGLAQGALDAAIGYAKDTTRNGKPLAKRQSVQFKIADMAAQVQAARLLVYKAAYLKDKGEPVTKNAAMAKLYAGEVGTRVAAEGMRLMGGAGYTTTHTIERISRDVKLCEIGEGTSEIQRLVIGRQLLGK